MAKVCSETLKLYKEIFDEAYLLGRTSGSQGVFICPNVAFEAFFKEKLSDEVEVNIEVSHEVSAFNDPEARVH